MADLVIQSGGLRPLDGAVTDTLKAAGALTLSEPAVKMATTGLQKTGSASDKCMGLVVATEDKDTSAASGEYVTVVLFGRVAGFSGMTPGKLIYLAATAGKLADTGSVAVGYSETDGIAMFMPGVSNAAS